MRKFVLASIHIQPKDIFENQATRDRSTEIEDINGVDFRLEFRENEAGVFTYMDTLELIQKVTETIQKVQKEKQP